MGSSPMAMRRALGLCLRETRAPLCQEEGVVARIRAEGAPHQVTLSTFFLDRTEVTVESYERCVAAGVCAPGALAPEDPRFTRPDLPMTQVRWDDAAAFCAWAGGRLPTEAEWEYAARGAEDREFPWGMLYNSHLANHGAWADDSTDASDGFVGLAPVGSFPDGATPHGLLDMAGNVAEWVADVFELDDTGTPVPYPATPEVDPPPKAAGGGLHVIRGGSYVDGALWLRSAARDSTASQRTAWIGFRCAANWR